MNIMELADMFSKLASNEGMSKHKVFRADCNCDFCLNQKDAHKKHMLVNKLRSLKREAKKLHMMMQELDRLYFDVNIPHQQRATARLKDIHSYSVIRTRLYRIKEEIAKCNAQLGIEPYPFV